MLKETAKEYFRQFSKKDLNALKSLFSENVTLQDWSTKAHGKTEVLSVNRKLFQSVKNINIVPIELFEDKNTIVAEIEIVINGGDNIKVVDIIGFDSERKIKFIRAYKG